jgi:hypothetical protein
MSDSSIETFIQAVESSIINNLATKQYNINEFKNQRRRATRPHTRGQVLVFNNPANFI